MRRICISLLAVVLLLVLGAGLFLQSDPGKFWWLEQKWEYQVWPALEASEGAFPIDELLDQFKPTIKELVASGYLQRYSLLFAGDDAAVCRALEVPWPPPQDFLALALTKTSPMTVTNDGEYSGFILQAYARAADAPAMEAIIAEISRVTGASPQPYDSDF